MFLPQCVLTNSLCTQCLCSYCLSLLASESGHVGNVFVVRNILIFFFSFSFLFRRDLVIVFLLLSVKHILLECPIITELFQKNGYDFIACNNVRDILYNTDVTNHIVKLIVHSPVGKSGFFGVFSLFFLVVVANIISSKILID